VFNRPCSNLFYLLTFVFVLILAASCDPVKKHKILTFFFDGVPPLGGEKIKAGDSNEPGRTNEAQNGSQPAIIWYTHEPMKDCGNCHEDIQKKGSFILPERITKQPVPELCFKCHPDDKESYASVHGPVAVGQCLICHEKHKSTIKHLLKMPEPGLCYKCHNESEIISVNGHEKADLSACTTCHDAHKSCDKKLLKTVSNNEN
jgi:predicted CXXCH cytochrome family protein